MASVQRDKNSDESKRTKKQKRKRETRQQGNTAQSSDSSLVSKEALNSEPPEHSTADTLPSAADGGSQYNAEVTDMTGSARVTDGCEDRNLNKKAKKSRRKKKSKKKHEKKSKDDSVALSEPSVQVGEDSQRDSATANDEKHHSLVSHNRPSLSIPPLHQHKQRGMLDGSADDEPESDDDDLLAAAEQWVSADGAVDSGNEHDGCEQISSHKNTETAATALQGQRAKRSKKNATTKKQTTSTSSSPSAKSQPKDDVQSSLSTPAKLSLHITQLPFDATDIEIRRIFTEEGCQIRSLRLVLDRGIDGRRNVFRGVAFLDLHDQSSYDTALAMHRKYVIRGRRINIRPTRSRAELANIVEQTKAALEEKIRVQLNRRAGEKSKGSAKNDGTGRVAKKTKAKHKLKPKSRDNGSAAVATTTTTTTKKSDGKWKLTKKQQKRRAAIIAAGVRKKRG